LARARRLSIAALLALMVLSFSAAAASIFEVEERSKQTAGLTSIVVLAGNDAVSGLVAITHRVEVSSVNRTIVAIEGYVGSIVRFDEVIKVCNLGAGDLHVRLVYAGTVNGSWKHVRYLTFWLARAPPHLASPALTRERLPFIAAAASPTAALQSVMGSSTAPRGSGFTFTASSAPRAGAPRVLTAQRLSPRGTGFVGDTLVR